MTTWTGAERRKPDLIAETMQSLTDRHMACPVCGTLLLGARVWDAARQEASVDVACPQCEQAYHVEFPS